MVAELGQDRSVEPGDALGHLQIQDLPELGAFNGVQAGANGKYFNTGPRPSNTSGFM